jgi:hypothetical protein
MLRAADSWTLPEGIPAAEALRILALAAVRLFTRSPAGPLMRSLVADAQSDPEIAQALREQWFAPRRAVAAQILREGMRTGELRPDLDLAATLDLIFAPVYYRLLFGHEPLDEEFAERTMDQALTGIARTAGDQDRGPSDRGPSDRDGNDRDGNDRDGDDRGPSDRDRSVGGHRE